MQDRFPETQIEALRTGIHEAVALLGQFPLAGAVDMAGSVPALRKLILRRVPFVVWYRIDESRRGDVWMLRLFHARQDRVHPRAGSRSGRKRVRR